MLYMPLTFNDLCTELNKKINFNNILIIRHKLTGQFMDNLFINQTNVTRLIYVKDNIIINPNIYNRYFNRNIIRHKNINDILVKLNIKYDLICLDPFHEYNESMSDLKLLTSFLTDNGILICHDCYPPNKICAQPYFTTGEWCGVTYGVFIEFAYNNPDWFYTILNTDFGLGIIRKKNIFFKLYICNLENNNINKDIQNQFIELLKKEDNSTYDFFIDNSKSLINILPYV